MTINILQVQVDFALVLGYCKFVRVFGRGNQVVILSCPATVKPEYLPEIFSF
jgi:hypothetical protein